MSDQPVRQEHRPFTRLSPLLARAALREASLADREERKEPCSIDWDYRPTLPLLGRRSRFHSGRPHARKRRRQ
jgi:hypothetical protein